MTPFKRAAAAVSFSVALHAAVALYLASGSVSSSDSVRTVKLEIAATEFSRKDTPADLPPRTEAPRPDSSVEERKAEAAFSAEAGPAISPPRPTVEYVPHVQNPREDEKMESPAESVEESGDVSDGAAVDAPARPCRPIVPVYPRRSRLRGEEGVVVLEAAVDESGRVADVRVVASSGYPGLDEAAVKALAEARFVPAERDGRPVGSRVRLPLGFRLKNR